MGQSRMTSAFVAISWTRRIIAFVAVASFGHAVTQEVDGSADRAFTVEVMTTIAEPVLDALSRNELKVRMPTRDWETERLAFTHFEAVARTLAGIAPWLELGPDDTLE